MVNVTKKASKTDDVSISNMDFTRALKRFEEQMTNEGNKTAANACRSVRSLVTMHAEGGSLASLPREFVPSFVEDVEIIVSASKSLSLQEKQILLAEMAGCKEFYGESLKGIGAQTAAPKTTTPEPPKERKKPSKIKKAFGVAALGVLLSLTPSFASIGAQQTTTQSQKMEHADPQMRRLITEQRVEMTELQEAHSRELKKFEEQMDFAIQKMKNTGITENQIKDFVVAQLNRQATIEQRQLFEEQQLLREQQQDRINLINGEARHALAGTSASAQHRMTPKEQLDAEQQRADAQAERSKKAQETQLELEKKRQENQLAYQKAEQQIQLEYQDQQRQRQLAYQQQLQQQQLAYRQAQERQDLRYSRQIQLQNMGLNTIYNLGSRAIYRAIH